MFRTKPLIGTPNDGGKRLKQFEFTPIGYNKGNDENMDPRTNTIKKNGNKSSKSARRNPFHRSPLENSVRGGSSFIEPESFDTIHYSDRNQNLQGKTSSPVPNNFDNHDLLNDGTNPIKRQQENVSKLQDENYNLKVKIASLTRFLNSITNNEQQEIYQQNSELQEKLIEMRGEISLLNQEIAESRLKSSSSTNNAEEIERYKSEIHKLNLDIQTLREENEDRGELSREVHKLHEIIEHLEEEHQKEKQSSISPTYVEKLEEQLDDIKDKLYETERELNNKNEEIEEKEARLDEMEELLKKHRTLSDQQQDEIDDEVESLKDIIRQKDNKLEKAENDLEELLDLSKQLNNKLQELEEEKELAEKLLKEKSKDSGKYKDEVEKFSQMQEAYSAKIHELKFKRNELSADIDDLRSQIKKDENIIRSQEKIINELRSSNNSNKEVHQFVEDLKAQIGGLEKDLQSLSLERDSLKKQLSKSDKEIIALKNNNERTYRAYNELKKSQTHSNIQQYKETHLDEDQEERWKSEVDYLSKQIKDLKVENKSLSRNLQSQRLDSNAYDKHEVKSLASKCNELQLDLAEKENQLTQQSTKHKRDIEKLKLSIKEKEDELRKVSDELRSMKYSTTQQIDDEKLQALKLKSSKEFQIKSLQIELDSLKEEHATEVKALRTLIERLKSSSTGKDFEDVRSRAFSSFDQTDLLSRKINDKNSKIKLLNNKLSEAISTISVLEKEISRLEDSKSSIISDNNKLHQKLEALNYELASSKRDLDSLFSKYSNQSDQSQLKSALKLRERQLEESNRDFNEMKNELFNKYKMVHEDKVALERKIEKIIKKYRQLQATPIEPPSNKELSIIQDQYDLYRMKYNKSTYVINDLKFINSFILKAIQATNTHIKKDVKKLQEAGIYPDYELICNKKPSLKVYFKFVLAAVRMKRKTQHSSIRNKKIEDLKFKLAVDDY